jgi:hypothetical protein
MMGEIAIMEFVKNHKVDPSKFPQNNYLPFYWLDNSVIGTCTAIVFNIKQRYSAGGVTCKRSTVMKVI